MTTVEKNETKLSGFSILEIVVVMAILVIIGALVMPTSVKDMRVEEVKTTASDIASQIRQQQNYAFNGRENKAYGISFTNNMFSTYSGNTISLGQDVDAFNTKPGIVISTNLTGNSTEINFQSSSLTPSVVGYINLTNDSATYRININKEGMISIEKI